MNFCIYCGTKISANDKFCPQCGKPIFGHPVNTSQKTETDKVPESPLESIPITDGQSVQDEESASEDAAIQDCKSENNSSAKQESGISVLAIVMCSIAAVMLIVFVILMVARTSDHNRIVSQTQTPKTLNGKTEKTTEIAIDLAKKWDEVHNSKKADDFANLYASQVKYYQQTYTPEMIVKSKRDLFAKTPDFLQVISKFEVTNNSDGSVKVHFDKLVQTSPKEARKTYPSYLVVKKIKGNWLIVEESDDVTDANLAKKKEKQIKAQLAKMEKLGDHYGIELYYKVEWDEGTPDDGSPDWFPQPAQYSLYAYYPNEIKLEKLITEPSYDSKVKCTKHQSLHPKDTGFITIDAIGYGYHSVSKDRIIVNGCPDSRNIYSYLFDIPTKKAVLLRSFDGFKEVRNEKGKKVIVMLAREYYPDGGFYYFENLYDMDGYYIGEGKKLED